MCLLSLYFFSAEQMIFDDGVFSEDAKESVETQRQLQAFYDMGGTRNDLCIGVEDDCLVKCPLCALQGQYVPTNSIIIVRLTSFSYVEYLKSIAQTPVQQRSERPYQVRAPPVLS